MCCTFFATAAKIIENDGVIGFLNNSSANFNLQSSPSKLTLSSRNSTILSSQINILSSSGTDFELWSRNFDNSNSFVSHCGFNWCPNSGAVHRRNVITEGRLRSSSKSSKQRTNTFKLWKSFRASKLFSSRIIFTARGAKARRIGITLKFNKFYTIMVYNGILMLFKKYIEKLRRKFEEYNERSKQFVKMFCT
jgi:hypothetical protein